MCSDAPAMETRRGVDGGGEGDGRPVVTPRSRSRSERFLSRGLRSCARGVCARVGAADAGVDGTEGVVRAEPVHVSLSM